MVFPGKYFPWQMRKCSPCLRKEKRDVWDPRAVRWLVEERLGMPVEEVPKRLELAHFYENGLGGLAKSCSNRLFVLADLGYPGLFRPWQLKRSKEWWKDDDLCRKAILWLLSTHRLDSPSVAHRIKRLDFKRAGLRRLLEVRFGGSVEAALEFVYPDKLGMLDPRRFNRGTGRKGGARRRTRLSEGV